MQERTLENLILNNENYIFDGDLTIIGDVCITNGDLLVSGKLLFRGFKEDTPESRPVIIRNGSIIAHSLVSKTQIFIYNGNLIVKTNANVGHVYCEGNVEVNGSCSTYNVTCHNYLITGRNASDDITATEDIYLLGPCKYLGDLTAREIFIGGPCEFDSQKDITIIAKHLECVGPLYKCHGMLIG